MPVYRLIKDGVVVNTIIADEVESIRDQYDLIEEVIPEPGVIVSTIDRIKVRNNLTFAEKVKWDNETTETIKTAKIEFAIGVQKTLEEAAEILDFMVESGDISRASADKILAA